MRFIIVSYLIYILQDNGFKTASIALAVLGITLMTQNFFEISFEINKNVKEIKGKMLKELL